MVESKKAPAAYYDPKRRAIIQEDIHLTKENQTAQIEKEYHTYNVAALENDVKRIDEKIALFYDHIEKEKKRREELLVLIEEGKERDEKLNSLLNQ